MTTTPLSSKIEAINSFLSDPWVAMLIVEHHQEGYRLVHLTIEAQGEFGAEATRHTIQMDPSDVELLPAKVVARALAIHVSKQISHQQTGLIERMRRAKRRLQTELALRSI